MEGRVAGKIGWLGANRARRICALATQRSDHNGVEWANVVHGARCSLPSARAFAVLFPTQGEPNGYQNRLSKRSHKRDHLFTTQANELALAPGLFNIPFGAYEEAPPAVPEGEVAQWNPTSSAWMAVEDHRGETFYLVKDGTAYEMGSSVEVDGEPTSYPGWGKVPAWLTLIPARGQRSWHRGRVKTRRRVRRWNAEHAPHQQNEAANVAKAASPVHRRARLPF